MLYKELIYNGVTIPAKPEKDVIKEMVDDYNEPFHRYRLIAYFNYVPEGLAEKFPLCTLETYESIIMRHRNWKPKEGKKWDLHNDRESIVFPKYSIVDCAEMPNLWGHKRIIKKFVHDEALRFIIFTNFMKDTAFFGCGSDGHVLFSSCYKD